jgi:hypothetical protein
MQRKGSLRTSLERLEREFRVIGFRDLNPSARQRVHDFAFEVARSAVSFSLSESERQVLFKKYVSCAGEFLIALQYRKSRLTKDRMLGKLPDSVTAMQYHLEQMMVSEFLDVSKDEYLVTMKTLTKLRDANLTVVSAIQKFIRRGQFTMRPIHLLHKFTIDLLSRKEKREAAFAAVEGLHNALFPEVKVKATTIKVEYFKILKQKRGK